MARRRKRSTSFPSDEDFRRQASNARENDRKFLEASKKLELALKNISQLNAQSSSRRASQICTELETAISASNTVLDHATQFTCYGEFCPPHARGLAQSVFDVPELFEAILQHLTIPELLVAQQVNHQWFDTIESSVKLQRQLSLRRDTDDGHFNTVFLRHEYSNPWPKLQTTVSCIPTYKHDRLNKRLDEKNPIEINAAFGWDGGSVPKTIGARYRRMFICQPPIKLIHAYTTCCMENPRYRTRVYGPSKPPFEVTNTDGITIGDLYDTAKELLEEHRDCEDADQWHHDDETGEVQVEVMFVGGVPLAEKDPLRATQAQIDLDRKQEGRESEDRVRRMRAFVRAKHTARDNGQIIPTFEDFKASRGESEDRSSNDDSSDDSGQLI